MNQFVDSFWFNQLLPPWYSTGARGWAFVIEVPSSKIQQHLDRRFNRCAPDRAPFHYEALPRPTFGLLRFVNHPNFRSGTKTGHGMNRISHRELTWTFPVHRHGVTRNNLIQPDPEIVWLQPFSFVDNSYLMYSSREILGNETQMAMIAHSEGPSALRVDAGIQGMRRFLPRSKSHLIGALAIDAPFEGGTPDGSELIDRKPGLRNFIETLSKAVGTGPEANDTDDGRLSPHVLMKGTSVDTIKQFRDIFDWDIAVYRALVATRMHYSAVNQVRFYSGDDIRVAAFWSDSMKEIVQRHFGIEEVPAGVPEGYPFGEPLPIDMEVDWRMVPAELDVALGISFEADLEIYPEGTLHTYGQAGSAATAVAERMASAKS